MITKVKRYWKFLLKALPFSWEKQSIYQVINHWGKVTDARCMEKAKIRQVCWRESLSLHNMKGSALSLVYTTHNKGLDESSNIDLGQEIYFKVAYLIFLRLGFFPDLATDNILIEKTWILSSSFVEAWEVFLGFLSTACFKVAACLQQNTNFIL